VLRNFARRVLLDIAKYAVQLLRSEVRVPGTLPIAKTAKCLKVREEVERIIRIIALGLVLVVEALVAVPRSVRRA